jgi:hypothetical protein
MILQRIRYFFTKNPLDLLDYDELISDRIRYNHDIKKLHERITAIEHEIDSNFDKAKETKSPVEERVLAEHINTLSQTRDSTLKKVTKAQVRLRTIEEFINKIEERNRKSSLDSLKTSSNTELEELLIKISEYEEVKYAREKTLGTITDSKSDEPDVTDDNVNNILQAIKATKTDTTYKVASDSEPVSTRQKSPEFEN